MLYFFRNGRGWFVGCKSSNGKELFRAANSRDGSEPLSSHMPTKRLPCELYIDENFRLNGRVKAIEPSSPVYIQPDWPGRYTQRDGSETKKLLCAYRACTMRGMHKGMWTEVCELKFCKKSTSARKVRQLHDNPTTLRQPHCHWRPWITASYR